MLKILGRRTSANVMKPLWLADELGLEVEQVDIGGPFGGNDQPEYLALNPTGLIPTMIDDGFVLWESNAITRYIAARYGGAPLYPDDLQTRALADQWMDWQQTTLVPQMIVIFWGLVRTREEDRDLAAIDRAKAKCAAVWRMLDAHLAHNAYVAGREFTMGDVPIGPQAHRWFELAPEAAELPRVRAWYERLAQRPAFRAHCMNPLE